MTDEILEPLNPDQKEAVLHFESPLLIIASAGSGKTKVITNKIVHLVLEKKYSPSNILGVTFTNKAADEMKSRVETLTGIEARLFNISTFHSLGLRILRESGSVAGFDRDWQVIDDQDQKRILDRIIKENFTYFRNDMKDEVKRKIGFAKMDLNYPNNREFLYQKGFKEDEVEVFSLYFNFQKEKKLWDYEDLVSLPVKLLQSNEDIRIKYAVKFQYVVVDEFQDTNPNQYELIRLIAGEHKNITIVGDDDQAIYSWRGASIRYLFNFQKDFPGTHVMKLEQNYRSTPQILNFANNMILKNYLRRAKAMWTEKKDSTPIFLLNTHSKEDEAVKAADFITRLKEEKPELFPVAVLYRINSQSLPFETEFAKRSIDFKIFKGLRFFDRKEIKDSLSLLKLAVNLDDDISFLRIIDFLSVGIGPKNLDSLIKLAKEKNLSLFFTLKEFMSNKVKGEKIFSSIYTMNQKQKDFKFSEILTILLKKSGYMVLLENKWEQDRLLNIRELIEFIKKLEMDFPGETLGQLLDRISFDSGDKSNKERDRSSVFLLTMHNAKGLEFPTVFAAGINTSYMPFFMRKDRVEIEEERRLFYVAATRAIKQLVISTGAEKHSRFLSEVNRSLYMNVFSIDEIFDSLAPAYPHTLPGTVIDLQALEKKYLEHPIFGKGKIINAIDKDKYIVDFVKKGEKTIDTSVVPVIFL